MGRLLGLEIKTLLRRPVWLLLVAFVGYIFYTIESFAPRIYIGLEMPLFDVWGVCRSVGELGRAILLTLETFGGLFLSLLTALMAMDSFAPELEHREILWASYNGTRLRFALAKLVAVSSFTVFVLALAACTAFLNPSAQETISLAGWQYLPLYLTLAWIRVALWVALAMFFFSLTRSRWATVFIVFALHMAWFGTAGIWWEPSLPRLLQRNFIAWNFISVFAPFGIIPRAFFLQGIMFTGIALALAGTALLVRRGFPEWAGLKILDAKAAVAGGVILALGAGWGVTQTMQAQTASFTAADLWDGEAVLDRPYIWSEDYRLLVYPGKYMAILLPPDTPIPGWVEQLATKEELRRHDNVKEIILNGHLGDEQSVASASLIQVYRTPDPYPRGLEKLAARYWQAVSPLVDQARPWLRTVPRLTVIWPEDVFPNHSPIVNGSEFRVCYASLCEPIKAQQRDAVSALSHALAPDRLIETYLAAYLMMSIDEEEVGKALEWLRNRAEGGTPDLEVLAGIGLHLYSWKPEEAAQVLQYWRQGEEMGHENYIRTLLEEGQGD